MAGQRRRSAAKGKDKQNPLPDGVIREDGLVRTIGDDEDIVDVSDAEEGAGESKKSRDDTVEFDDGFLFDGGDASDGEAWELPLQALIAQGTQALSGQSAHDKLLERVQRRKESKVATSSSAEETGLDTEGDSDSAPVAEEEGGGEPAEEQSASEEEADDDSDTPAHAAANHAESASFFASGDVRHADTFGDLHLSRPLLTAVNELGFSQPTPIQSSTIPVALQGRDVCASAETGSGKTAAFSLPILERLLFRPRRVPITRVLILAPARELATQCYSMFCRLAKHTDVRAALLIGGVSVRDQETMLRSHPDVIIATPGRVIDHLHNTQGFSLEDIEVLVLDECDRLLELGFEDELREIVRSCPQQRQTMLFSATFTDDVKSLMALSLNRPVRVRVDSTEKAAAKLQQEFIRLRPERIGDREPIFLALCKRTFREGVMVFFRKKADCHRAMLLLSLCDMKAAELHGNLTQLQRLESLEKFRNGEVKYLLCTDVASRGLDIGGVKTVINYEMPRNVAEYIHRVGRTARAGRSGRSVTIVADSERKILRQVLKTAGKEGIQTRKVPKEAVDACRGAIERFEDDVTAIMEEEREEKELDAAEMEVTKARNMVDHAAEIAARPRRTWFQSEADKKRTKERAKTALNQNEQSLMGEEGEENGDDADSAVPALKPSRADTRKRGQKRDKYAGMSRAKRRRTMLREAEDVEGDSARQAGKARRKKRQARELAASGVDARTIDRMQKGSRAKKRRTARPAASGTAPASESKPVAAAAPGARKQDRSKERRKYKRR